MMIKKFLLLILVFIAAFNFYMLAQGPPPPPSQGGGPAGVPLDGASGMIILAALGMAYKKYFSKKKTSEDSLPSNPSS